MKLKLYIFLLAFSCQFMSFGQTLDQSNTSATAAVESLFGGSTQNLSQSFTVGNSGQLSRISVNVDNVTNGPTLYVNCDLIIYNGEGFGGAVLGTYGFAVPDYVSGEFAINFAPIAVTSNQIITFKIVANTTSLGRVTLLTTNDTYAGGVFYNDALQAIATRDLWFKTYVTQSAATHLNFDGINDYVALPNESSFDFTDQMTVEFWMNSSVTNPEQWDALVVKGDDSWRVHLNATGTVYFTCSSGTSTLNAISTTVVTDGNWHHIAATLGGNTAKIFIDGVLEDQVAVPGILNNSTYPILIGNNPVFGPRYFTGNLDDVRIWNIARTAEQLNGSKNCELQGTETGLVAYYKFNQGLNAANNSTITSLTDATANANNGTLTNFTLIGTTSNFLAGSPVTTGSIVPSNATVTSQVFYNQGDTATALTATTGTNGTGLIWYTSAIGGTGTTTAPTPSTATAGNTSYWVASSNANGCESARTEIVVTVNAAATHLNFDGFDDSVNCGNNSSVQLSGNQITLEAYVKFDSFKPNAFEGNIINKEQNSPDFGYMLRAGSTGVINFNIGNGNNAKKGP